MMNPVAKHAAVVVVVFLGLVGCSETSAPVLPETNYILGSRALPGCEIEVVQSGKAISERLFTVKIKEEHIKDCRVEARIGTAYDADAGFISMALESGGGYAGRLSLPDDISDARLFVRITMDDGSVVESGADDFAIAR